MHPHAYCGPDSRKSSGNRRFYSFSPKELIETDRLKLSCAKAAAELSAIAGGFRLSGFIA
jgi:hypothetical protein